jgi:glycosyltransferase 2 family protein
MNRHVKTALKILVSLAILAFLLWQINVRQTISLIADANALYLFGALAIFLVTTVGMAWRWQLLLAAKGIKEPLGWLTRLYFIGYAAGQIMPTGIGGDAVRIVEHSRRRPDRKGDVAAAVVLERVIGAAGTLVMVGIGLIAAIGRYDDIQYLVWIELVFIALVAAGFVLMFSKRAGRMMRWLGPLASRLHLERAGRGLYEAMHEYRYHSRSLLGVLAVTVVIQFVRVVSIWLCGLAVGVDVSPLVYVILGPLLFLVMMVPFTINGLGVREAFFVAFLGRFGVDADAAFATGFLFYAVTIATSLPGGVILLWRSIRPMVVPSRHV